tara:strand:+ start:9 stop:1001 length:993 start_codon:yes stop_codon:yes gene_type:complete
MSLATLSTFLNVKDSHLRVVSGNVYARAMNIGGINIDSTHGLEAVTETGNITHNTLQFLNETTAFVTTSNVHVGKNVIVDGNNHIHNELYVSGNVHMSSDTIISGNLEIASDISITGNANVSSNMVITDNVVSENVITHNKLSVGGDAYISSNLSVGGDVSITKGLIIDNDIIANGNVTTSNFIKYDSAWFYAYNGTSSGSGIFDDYSGFVPWNSTSPGSSNFTNNVSTSGGYYTAPVDGIYHLNVSVLNYPHTRVGISELFFSVNGDINGKVNGFGYVQKKDLPDQESISSSSIYRLNKGDVIKVYVTNIDCYTNSNSAFFSGYLISRI